jgi:hypothetical protein
MKSRIIFLLLLIYSVSIKATERPETIPSKISELKSKGWYQSKYDLWKEYLVNNPSDKMGWVELYKAAKYSGFSSDKLNQIADEVFTYHPESPQSNYIKSQNQGWTSKGVENLETAILKSEQDDFLEERLLLSEYKLSTDRKAQSELVFKNGMIHESTLNYAYNVLMSVNEDGILITEATHTTIPLWILQDVMSVRTDVNIINLELASDENYLKRKLISLGLAFNPSIFHLAETNPEQDFFYALTLSRKNLLAIDNNLYVVGLASQFESKRLEHYKTLKENLENRFLLDYLTIDFNGEPNTATGNALKANYIVPFIHLKEYYDELGESERSDFWRKRLINIADETDLKSQVELLLTSNSGARASFKKVDIDIKSLDKSLKKIKGNIYASFVELKNADYDFFLRYLKENDYTELFDVANVDLSKYEGFSYNFHKSYHFGSSGDPKNPTKFGNYPVMDISFEAAKIYCEWLTVQYNQQEGREFKKVKFRLPSKNEWTMAALGYKDFQSWTFSENTIEAVTGGKGKPQAYSLSEYTISYPWYGMYWEFRNSIINNKKCYLANVKTTEEILCPANIKGDGYEITSPVGTYFANSLGLYDVIGNVAEMTDIEGLAMGGSWNHEAEQSTITSIVKYEGADTSVGLRLFMEVIEE